MRFVDVSYFRHATDNAGQLLHAHAANLGYLNFLPENWEAYLVKFLRGSGQLKFGSTNYHFFKAIPFPLWVPWRANNFIAGLRPDVVLVHSLIFPGQIIALRAALGPKTKIIVQHHAEHPGGVVKRRLQRFANRFVNGYLFASRELAEPWIKAGIISPGKVFEVMEGSSMVEKRARQESRQKLGIGEEPVFLWVNRLVPHKDPATVLTAFEKYLQHRPGAKLYMIYQETQLLNVVKNMVHSSKLLSNAVELKGKVNRDELGYWYSAADYYISGSHQEGSGYALIEAMSCGCIPIVTDIPSFKTITGNGKAGLIFKHGDAGSLYNTLMTLEGLNKEQLTNDVLLQFEKELSFKAIAEQLVKTISLLP